jgi:UPF0716 family protein affecting phage T7 exclusion
MASVWGQLKRRNVVKVAVAYAIVGWILVEISSVLGPALNLPGWVTSFVAFLLILGFPVAKCCRGIDDGSKRIININNRTSRQCHMQRSNKLGFAGGIL